MPSKYRIILEMASQTARDIASNADRYTDFLITAANNYKYSFKEQLLIHAQKPDATACAEIDTWNKLGRWVNKGTKGIALLIDRDVPYKLRHVFDISDTNSRAGRNITLWQMKPEYEYAVSESLQASFGDVEEPRDFPHLLMDISGYAVEDNLSDYLMELNAVKAGSFLEELDDTSLEAWLKTTLKSSVAFMALSRAGYEPRQYFDREDFSHLFDFNTVEVISVLGAAVSDISEMVIREMGETVKEMEKEEKRKIRTFAQEGASAYHKNRTENKERSNEYGTDLYDAGRLSDSRSDRAGEPEAWEVWNAAADIPPRAPGWDLHRDAAERNTERPSGGSGPASQRDDGTPDPADGGEAGRDGAAEGGGSNAVGANDELHSPLGGGSGSERPDLRVTLPTVEQQQENIAEAEEEKSSAFSISQEDIDAILTRGSGIHQGKFRIYEQFLKQDSSENNIAFLKNEYGIGGAYPAVSGRNLDESHDAKGIKISRGRISQPDAELLLRWNKVEKRIGELIRADRYLSQAEKDDYSAYREQAETRRKRGEISDEFRSIVYDYNDFVTQLGEESKALNLYYLSSCWSAFSVGDKKMHARTAEGDFILPMMCEAMNAIIADNTHLTARCEAMLEALNSDVAKPLEPTFDELNPPPEPQKEYRYPEDYGENVRALEAVQPVDLTASEISVRLGATWLPPETIEEFMFELFSTPRYCQWNIHVHYAQYTGEWNVEGKSYDRSNVKAHNTYGTGRVNGYKIMEETLNLRDVRIFDYIEDANGRKTAVLNKKETAIAQGKQELIKQAFADWIWSDPERREQLTKLYNEKFNSIRPREYDGSHLNFVGINPEITLRPHQVNAIAHILYGGNTLLAHVVGAGKTFEMVAAAQESKRLGLCQKSLFVVPNHLTEQWASEYLQLYPSANILVATKKDFETKNRKKFCGRIATGDYDAVIIGHSQFEKIPMSLERQRAILQQQLDEVLDGISELKKNRGDNFSIKQLERTKKTVKQKLDKLNDQSRKDDVVTFEELGVDRIFIDEAHYYKNLAAFTKMRNVGGISQTEAMKSSDLYMKCRYLDQLTGGRGVVFATGTPISNSMVEMYTMQKYLQYSTLKRNDLLHFDAWASTFGETVTAIELSPEGTGYRAKTRFAKFYNLPELMAMFKETADIQTADMLKLPVPEAHYHSVVLKPSETQKEMVASLSERAERVRNKMVDSSVDNMLLITNDGRKLALDQRLMNDMLPDSETSKVGACAENVFDIWQRTADRKSTQMVFCDLSTPHGDGKFNVYDDLRNKLIAKGVPAEEIAYIHTANSEAQKKELFGKVRSGQVRVLIGSTQKMGAGTNVQTKLAALHHLDCPWRPSDLQQREGRIIRQGNENKEVDIYTYVTENTFDSYLYQLVESKQKFIGQIMTSKSPVRSAEDIDETALSYAEIKALCAGNPHIKEKMDLDIDVSRLKLLKANHLSQRYSLEDQILKEFPQKIKSLEQRIEGYRADIDQRKRNIEPNEDGFSPMFMPGGTVREKKAAGDAILGLCKSMTSPDPIPIGQYRGFDMELSFDTFSREYKITLIHQLRHTVTLGTDIFGNIQRLDNTLGAFEERMAACAEQLENTRVQLENAKAEVQKPFPQEEELKAKSERLNELNAMLNLDKRENEIVDGERGEEEPQKSSADRER